MIALVNYANEKYRKTQKFNSWTGKYIGKFDSIFEYTYKDIDKKFFEQNKEILLIERGNGLWLWKPYFILKTLKELNENDVLFYCDSGCFFIGNVKKKFEDMVEDIWVTDLPLLEKQFTKMDALILMDCNDEIYKETNQIQGSFLAIKKTDFSIEFVEKWLKYCEDIRILGNKDNVMGIENDGSFVSHREDQSILSLLCKKYHIKAHLDPTQYGKLPEKYFHFNKYIFSPKVHELEYNPFIVIHRTNNVNFKVCIKQFMCAILPIKIARLFLKTSSK